MVRTSFFICSKIVSLCCCRSCAISIMRPAWPCVRWSSRARLWMNSAVRSTSSPAADPGFPSPSASCWRSKRPRSSCSLMSRGRLRCCSNFSTRASLRWTRSSNGFTRSSISPSRFCSASISPARPAAWCSRRRAVSRLRALRFVSSSMSRVRVWWERRSSATDSSTWRSDSSRSCIRLSNWPTERAAASACFSNAARSCRSRSRSACCCRPISSLRPAREFCRSCSLSPWLRSCLISSWMPGRAAATPPLPPLLSSSLRSPLSRFQIWFSACSSSCSTLWRAALLWRSSSSSHWSRLSAEGSCLSMLTSAVHPQQVTDAGHLRQVTQLQERPLNSVLARRVSHNHELRGLGGLVGLLLDNGGDAHRVVAEGAGDAGEDARPVGHLQPDVAAAHQLRERLDGYLGGVTPGERPPALDNGAGCVQNVRHDGGGRRQRAGSGALEQDATGEVALDLDGVEGAVHLGQQFVLRQQRRGDARLYGGILPAGDGQQLYRVAQLAGVEEIARRQAAYALPVDVFGPYAGVEGKAGQDRQLVGGVVPVDVVRGVGLGVAKLLRLGQSGGEVQAVTAHAGQDVVRRAVDYGADAEYLVGGEVALEGRDDRDAAADACLVEDVHPLLSRQPQQLRAVLGHDLLVGGDDVASARERVLDQLLRGVLAAHQLHDDVHVAGERLLRAHGEEAGIDLDRALLLGVADEYAAQVQRGADAAGVGLCPLAERSGHSPTNNPQPQKDDVYLGGHGSATASSGRRGSRPTRSSSRRRYPGPCC